MTGRLTLAAAGALIGFVSAAQAEILAAGPVYGGPASVGGTVVCRLFNFGLVASTVTIRQIWNNAGGITAPTVDSCNVALVSGKSCEFSAPIAGNLAFSCRVFVTGIDDKISGVAEIQAPGTHAILNSIPLGK
jgi:hypothetical protein